MRARLCLSSTPETCDFRQAQTGLGVKRFSRDVMIYFSVCVYVFVCVFKCLGIVYSMGLYEKNY
jgi:hypothetical protein